LAGCRGELSGGHATEVPGFFAYSHQQIRRNLRARGYSDRLSETPDRAVRRSAGHEAIICLTQQTGDARVLASIWSAGAATRTVSLESEMIYLDASFRPVASPGGRYHRTDPAGRNYVDNVGHLNIAHICRIDRPGVVLAETRLMTHYVFSTEKRVFLFGVEHEKDDGCNWCLIFDQSTDGLKLAEEHPLPGMSSRTLLMRILDLDEERELLVEQAMDHEDSRRDEWFLIDLKTGSCKNLGRFLSRDFGFFLKVEPFGNCVSGAAIL
jgi:hypothetical protein